MRKVSWWTAPAIFVALLGQTASAADTPKPGPTSPAAAANKSDPASIRADKAALLASRIKVGPTAANNNPPPAGAILDLSGTPIPGHGNSTFQQYTVSFVAALANTAITIAIREDPAYITIEQVVVQDMAAPGTNLLVNGDFSGTTYTGSSGGAEPSGWTYANIYGASASGRVTSGCGGPTPNSCYYDGAVQAYDAISQTVATTIGHTYQISFYLADNSGQATFNRLSAPGVAGIDVTVYAQAGLPAAGNTSVVPTLSDAGLFLMALLLATAGLVLVRRTQRAS